MGINTDAKPNYGIMDAAVSGISAVPATRKQKKSGSFSQENNKNIIFFKGSSRLTALPNKHGHHATLSKETKSC